VRVVLGITGCDKANVAHLLTCLLQDMEPRPALVLQMGIAGALPSPGPGPGAAVGDIVIATQETYSDTGSSSPGGWLSAAELGLPIACVDGKELGGSFRLDVGLTLAAQDIIEHTEWPESVRAAATGAGQESGGDASNGPHSVTWPVVAGRPDGQPAVLLGPCVTSSTVTGLHDEALHIGARWGALAESMEGAAAAHVCALYGVPFLEVRGISNLVTDRDRDSWQVRRAAAVAGWATLAVMAAFDRLPLTRTEADARR
jgi:futalosine hydrolase